ncbi:MAG: DMT family transporter [Hydrogenophaga sp.]|nr:DMT family transporter [Hydrogenophaga sp.]
MTPILLLEFVVLAALWGASFLFMRLGAAEFGPVATAGLRVGIAALCLLPVFLKAAVWADFRARWRAILIVGLLNSGLPFLLFSFAVLHIPTGISAILNATVPLTGALVAWLWLKDRPGGSRVLGLVIGFIGVTLLVLGKSGVDARGLAVAGGHTMSLVAMGACLLATTCYGIAASFTKRFLSGVHPLASATGSQIGATLALALPTLWLWPANAPGTGAWGAIVALAVLCTSIAYILYFHLIERAGPARALTVTFMIPVFALIYGAAFLGETISVWMVICGVVIVCGTALSTGLVRVKALQRAA